MSFLKRVTDLNFFDGVSSRFTTNALVLIKSIEGLHLPERTSQSLPLSLAPSLPCIFTEVPKL